MTINKEDLKVVRLGGKNFYNNDESIYCICSGYAIKHNTLGYLSFTGCHDDRLVKVPYQPSGGRKVLLSIVTTGLTGYDNVTWLTNHN